MTDIELMKAGVVAECRKRRETALQEVAMWKDQPGDQVERLAKERGRASAFREVIELLT